MAVVITVQGPSGSGKTTLIERVVARLRARGLSVGVMKHAHEGLTLDRRGKDSQRFWTSGAQAVLVAGPDELFVRQRRSWSPTGLTACSSRALSSRSRRWTPHRPCGWRSRPTPSGLTASRSRASRRPPRLKRRLDVP